MDTDWRQAYTEAELASFDEWTEVEEGPPHKRVMDCAGPGPKANKMLYEPLQELARDGDPHATDDALVTSTIINHERGLRKRIIRITSTCDGDGRIDLLFDKLPAE